MFHHEDKEFLHRTFRSCIEGNAKIYQAMLVERIDPSKYEELHKHYTDKEMVDNIRSAARTRLRQMSKSLSSD